MKGIPIINENDTVATDEIKFGDNDILSALVANMVSADLLIILSDVDGLLEKDGRTLLRTVYEINPKIEKLACPTKKKTCVGGMVTKIEAAKIAMNSGIPCVIANGRLKNIVLRLAENPAAAGTLFVPKKGLAAKKRWIAFGVKPKGRIIVDDGARNALIGHKSLLAVGIVDIGGDFEAGDIVGIADKHYVEFARGKINFSSKQLERLKGQRLDKEVIHCDNISILT
jgi:glutamate 5-kinase